MGLFAKEGDSDFTPYDPRGALNVKGSNDVEKGYQMHHFRSVLAADERGFSPDGRLDALRRVGWDVVDTDLEYESMSYDVITGPDSATDIGKAHSRRYLGACLDPNDEQIRQYFSCDYAPISLSVVRVQPNEDNVSMRWHCDSGPTRHLKMLVYLNETDGATGVIERMDTDLFFRAGYAYCGLEQRLGDDGTREFALKQEIPFYPTFVTPPPGQAILFEPALVMHRGKAPTEEERVMLQIILVPEMRLWRDHFDSLWPTIEGNVSAATYRSQN